MTGGGSEIQEEKAALRAQFKVLAKTFFDAHDETALKRIHTKIALNLAAYCAEYLGGGKLPRRIAIYEPMRYELPVRQIASEVPALAQAQFLYPEYDETAMWFVSEDKKKAEPELIIVPGLFVDRQGNRLGRGKGYYDRYLSRSPLRKQSHIFLGYDFQVLDRIPAETHDIGVGGIIAPASATGINP